MAESDSTPKAQHTPGWRTDDEVRDEHDRLATMYRRLATIYRQRGLLVLIETTSDEIMKLRRASLELAGELRALISLLDRDVPAHPCPGFDCAWCARPNTAGAHALLARLDG